jgi:hypothetical protein
MKTYQMVFKIKIMTMLYLSVTKSQHREISHYNSMMHAACIVHRLIIFNLHLAFRKPGNGSTRKKRNREHQIGNGVIQKEILSPRERLKPISPNSLQVQVHQMSNLYRVALLNEAVRRTLFCTLRSYLHSQVPIFGRARP